MFAFKRFISRGGIVTIKVNPDGMFVELFAIVRIKQKNTRFQGHFLCEIAGSRISDQEGDNQRDLLRDMEHRLQGRLVSELAAVGGHGEKRTSMDDLFLSSKWKETTGEFPEILEQFLATVKKSKNSTVLQVEAVGPRICDCPHCPAPKRISKAPVKTLVASR